MSTDMVFITLLLTAGILQTFRQRFTETPRTFMVVQEKIAFFYWLRVISGVVFPDGRLTYIASFFLAARDATLRRRSRHSARNQIRPRSSMYCSRVGLKAIYE
jgi:nitric oxide reductase large subunit